MVLVLDTLGARSGNGQPFSHPARLAAVRCAQVVAATLERVEAQQYEQEVGLLADLTRSNARLLEEAPARQQALQQAEEDAASKLPEDAFETERRAEVARARFHIGREHARDALQALEGVAQLRIAPKSEVVAALCAAARLSGEEVPADWPVLCEVSALLAGRTVVDGSRADCCGWRAVSASPLCWRQPSRVRIPRMPRTPRASPMLHRQQRVRMRWRELVCAAARLRTMPTPCLCCCRPAAR